MEYAEILARLSIPQSSIKTCVCMMLNSPDDTFNPTKLD